VRFLSAPHARRYPAWANFVRDFLGATVDLVADRRARREWLAPDKQ
jgi:hypothetical protein